MRGVYGEYPRKYARGRERPMSEERIRNRRAASQPRVGFSPADPLSMGDIHAGGRFLSHFDLDAIAAQGEFSVPAASCPGPRRRLQLRRNYEL